MGGRRGAAGPLCKLAQGCHHIRWIVDIEGRLAGFLPDRAGKHLCRGGRPKLHALHRGEHVLVCRQAGRGGGGGGEMNEGKEEQTCARAPRSTLRHCP